MSQNDNLAIESGKFFGSFLITLIFETIDKVLSRKNKSNDDIAASVKDWGSLIKQVNMFKTIHAFAQEFLDQFSVQLFGNNDKYILESVNDIQEAWTKHYKGKYSEKISKFKGDLDFFKAKTTQTNKDISLEIKEEWKMDYYTETCLLHLKTFVPSAIEAAEIYVDEIQKIASLALERKILADDLAKWTNGLVRRDTEGKARLVLSRADDVLIAMIQVLSFLYSRTIPA